MDYTSILQSIIKQLDSNEFINILIMNIDKEINAKILATTMEIKAKHPELSQFLEEMPVTIPSEGNPKVNRKILNDYHDSLKNILKKYE